MYDLAERNRKIIDAVIRKEKLVCPGSVALIGIYGSFANGDVHPRSDLDLLIVKNDDRAEQLARTFIQEDLSIGHDIYCTSWESLRQDAQYEHPHISKLMDAEMVYCADEQYAAELERLREQTRAILSGTFGEADYEKADGMLRQAKICFANALICDDINKIRMEAGGALYFLENAIAMLNKTYFRLGTKRRLEELSSMKRVPPDLLDLIGAVVNAETAGGVKESLAALMKAVSDVFDKALEDITPEKQNPSAGALEGTYEEMYSNWRGKMYLAAGTGNSYLAYSSLVSFGAMMSGISAGMSVGDYDAMSVYDPNDLPGTEQRFDAMLERYLSEYHKAGIKARSYPDIDSFVEEYLK